MQNEGMQLIVVIGSRSCKKDIYAFGLNCITFMASKQVSCNITIAHERSTVLNCVNVRVSMIA